MRYTVSKVTGAVPVVFCRRVRKWLPMEEHLACEYAAGPVWDENGDPVSLLCLYGCEKRKFQEFEDIADADGGSEA